MAHNDLPKRMDCLLIMGVAGSGKTTLGKLLSESLSWPFIDADEHHSAANIKKMSKGIPLSDEDRLPWLDTLSGLVAGRTDTHVPIILACSALKKKYRVILSRRTKMVIVHLKGTPEVLARRLEERTGHFMNSSLLASQLADLEDPDDCLTLNPEDPPQVLIQKVVHYLTALAEGE